MRATFPILLLAAGSTLLQGQSMVEYGVGMGRAGAAGAGVGKSVVKTIGRLDKTLAGAATANSDPLPSTPGKTTAPAVAPAAAAPVIAPASAAQFAEIIAGMDKAEMVKKVGKPSMTMTGFEKSALVETCWYRSGDDNIKIILRNGKVATINGLENLPAQ